MWWTELSSGFALCPGSDLNSHSVKSETSPPGLVLSEATQAEEEAEDLLRPGRGAPLSWCGTDQHGKQAVSAKQEHAPTHHTSRHPNGAFVPLVKEAETIRCGRQGHV